MTGSPSIDRISKVVTELKRIPAPALRQCPDLWRNRQTVTTLQNQCRCRSGGASTNEPYHPGINPLEKICPDVQCAHRPSLVRFGISLLKHEGSYTHIHDSHCNFTNVERPCRTTGTKVLLPVVVIPNITAVSTAPEPVQVMPVYCDYCQNQTLFLFEVRSIRANKPYR